MANLTINANSARGVFAFKLRVRRHFVGLLGVLLLVLAVSSPSHGQCLAQSTCNGCLSGNCVFCANTPSDGSCQPPINQCLLWPYRLTSKSDCSKTNVCCSGSPRPGCESSAGSGRCCPAGCSIEYSGTSCTCTGCGLFNCPAAPTSAPTNPPTSAPTNPPTNPPTSAPTNPPMVVCYSDLQYNAAWPRTEVRADQVVTVFGECADGFIAGGSVPRRYCSGPMQGWSSVIDGSCVADSSGSGGGSSGGSGGPLSSGMIAGVVIGTIALLLVVGAVVAIRIVRTKNAARKSTDNYNALETVKKDTTSTGTASYQWQPTSTGTASYQWQPTPDAVPLSAGSESDHPLGSTTPALSTWTAPSTK
jgi:hypothetical protein